MLLARRQADHFDHMVTPEVRALPVDEYDKHMDRYMLDILDMDFERGLEASDDPMVEMFDNDDLILYIWNTHVFHKMVTTNGAERFYTQLISLIFDFTTVEVEINCDSLGYDISMYLIHSDPQTAYKLLHSGMRIARVCNLPEDATDLDSRTMFAFSLYDTEEPWTRHVHHPRSLRDQMDGPATLSSLAPPNTHLCVTPAYALFIFSGVEYLSHGI